MGMMIVLLNSCDSHVFIWPDLREVEAAPRRRVGRRPTKYDIPNSVLSSRVIILSEDGELGIWNLEVLFIY